MGFIVQSLKAMGLSLGNHLLMGQISVMSFRVQQQVTKPQKSYNTKFTEVYAWKQSSTRPDSNHHLLMGERQVPRIKCRIGDNGVVIWEKYDILHVFSGFT